MIIMVTEMEVGGRRRRRRKREAKNSLLSGRSHSSRSPAVLGFSVGRVEVWSVGWLVGRHGVLSISLFLAFALAQR